MTARDDKRPVFLDLTRIHLPVMAVLSLGHRVSGVLLVCAMPPLVWLFGRSLAGAEEYAAVRGLLASGPARIALVLLAWACAHHVLAGVRFLLLDLGVGVDARSARAGAWAVLAGGLLVMCGTAFVLS